MNAGLRRMAMAVALGVATMATALGATPGEETPAPTWRGALVDSSGWCMQRGACPITGRTRAYALRLPDGRLLDLDEGGTTYASAAITGSPAGQAMLNQKEYEIRPRATVKGFVHGAKIIVQSVTIE